MRQDIKYWIAFSKINSIGPVRFKKLFSYFASMEEAWHADHTELSKAGLEPRVADIICSSRDQIDVQSEIEKMAIEDISAVTILDENYPALLNQIYDPPAILYYKGTLNEAGDETAIGVVGTRKFSAYGKRVIENIIPELAKMGITIVSGLALGIDALAHEAVIRNNGRTIAVLGSGIDRQNIYPSINRYLAVKIIENNGLIISEYPIGTLPIRQNFPQRNRIISGLSKATLVIEAPEKSGALLTAKCALEQNRDVFAVPGSIFEPNAKGTNNLIKMGAAIVTTADDICEVLNLKQIVEEMSRDKIKPENDKEALLFNILSSQPMHIDEVIKQSGLSTSQVNGQLAILEMKGAIKNLGKMMYVLQ